MRRYFVIGLTALVFMPIVAVVVLALTNRFDVKELRVFGEVPEFQLLERSGKTLASQELKGKVWVASFIFTHCSGQCPIMCKQMANIGRKLRFKEHFRLVSITVDPDRDTPPVLKEYAKRYDADPYKWFFLTGQRSEIMRLVKHGFRLASATETEAGSNEDILHSDKLVLVDSFGRIRGYYDAQDDGSMKTLLADAKSLIRKAF